MTTNKIRRATIFSFAATLIITMGACSRPTEDPEPDSTTTEEAAGDTSSEEPIRIGFTGVLSGPSASAGEGLLEGLEIQIDKINDSGGLLDGRPVELVERDHGTNPDTAVANIRELIENEDVAALIGESTTGPLLATAPIASEAGVPWVVAGGTGTKATEQPDPNYMFRVSLVDDEQTGFAVDEALARGDNVALMTDTSGLGQGGRTDLLEAMEDLDVSPVADETFNVGDTDMTSQLSRIKEAEADIIIFWGVGPEAAQIRRGMDALEMLDTPMLANWGLGMPNYPELAGELADGTLVIQAYSFYETTDPQAQEVLETYEETFGTDRMTFTQELVNAYDAMGLLANAITQAGSTERDAIRDGLLDAQFDGLMRSYDKPWTEDDREALGRDDFIITEVQEGNLVPIDTP